MILPNSVISRWLAGPVLSYNVSIYPLATNRTHQAFKVMGKKALVFGASGVTGWSFINELLHDYPRKGLWDGVAAMTNRPLKQEDSLWPADSRLQIVSGVDLLDDPENVECALKEKVRGVHEITHVYYLGRSSTPTSPMQSRTIDLALQPTKPGQTCRKSSRRLSTCSKLQQ